MGILHSYCVTSSKVYWIQASGLAKLFGPSDGGKVLLFISSTILPLKETYFWGDNFSICFLQGCLAHSLGIYILSLLLGVYILSLLLGVYIFSLHLCVYILSLLLGVYIFSLLLGVCILSLLLGVYILSLLLCLSGDFVLSSYWSFDLFGWA